MSTVKAGPRPPQSKAQCDTLIKRAAGIADLVRGNSKAVELRTCMQWRTDIYSIVTQDQHAAPYIYTQLREFFKEDVRVHFVEAGKGQRDLFQFVATFFRDFKAIARAIEFAFAYLDQYFTKRSENDPLQVMIYKIFRVSGYEVVKGTLLDSIITRMNAWREGEQQDIDQLRSSVDFFQTIGTVTAPKKALGASSAPEVSLFKRDFLEPCINRSKAYYKKLAATKQASVIEEGVVSYFGWAHSQIEREEILMRSLGLSSSWPDIKGALVATLVTDPHVELLRNTQCGLAVLLAERRDVTLLFQVISLVPEQRGIDSIASTYSAFITNTLTNLFADGIAQADKPGGGEQAGMKAIMDFLFTERTVTIPQQFERHTKLYAAWDQGTNAYFKTNINIPRLLCDHIDAYLHNNKSDDEAAEGDMLDFFKNTFACVVDKLEFFANYKASLARRLLRGQFRRTLESQFLARLKVISGNAEVYPLNAMIIDLDNSEKLSADMLGNASMDAFLTKEKLKARTVLVTSQYWPTFEYIDIRLPQVFSSFVTLFESFYQSRFPNRRVRWIYQSSTAVVNTRFAQGPKELSGSLIQTSVLLQVDGTNGLRIPDLVQATGLPKETIADAIASMYMNKKVNVLECVDPATGAVTEVKKLTDNLAFRVNVGFKSATRKLDLPKPRAAKGIDMTQLENLRKELGKIAIVRFMKSRGTATYAEMVDAALADLRRKFDAQPPLVKAQLEFLIDKEIVRRDEKDPSTLIYIA